LLPLITQSSPSRTARVLIAATSEPASGSVTAMALTTSPRIDGTRYCCRSPSLPKSCSEGVAMSVWTLTARPAPEFPQRTISSSITAVKE
jgi:hypothetical protein